MKKIIIIKLGAKGDVVRTFPILPALKKKYPESKIFWITRKNTEDLLENSPYIEKVFALPYSDKTKYDLLFNFDIEQEALDLALKIDANEKYGFYSENGYPIAFNPESEYYLNTIFDDELKKNNKKTYQQMIFEIAKLEYHKEYCPIFLNKKDHQYADDFAAKNSVNKENLIGIHMGASPRWPSKVWAEKNLKEFISLASKKGYEIILFGGPVEIKNHKVLAKYFLDKGIKIYQNNPKNSDRKFVSLVNLCKVMVCSDSYALHVSLALKKPTIGLFFCTPPNEVEGYSLLKKLVSPMLNDFFPERMNEYSKELTESISANEVLLNVEELFKNKA